MIDYRRGPSRLGRGRRSAYRAEGDLGIDLTDRKLSSQKPVRHQAIVLLAKQVTRKSSHLKSIDALERGAAPQDGGGALPAYLEDCQRRSVELYVEALARKPKREGRHGSITNPG